MPAFAWQDFHGANPESVEDFESTYDRLPSQTRFALPATKIVLGGPSYCLSAVTSLLTRSSLLKMTRVVEKLRARNHLPVVHYQEAFTDA